jgi:SOS response regulatory protein OraA/RecX
MEIDAALDALPVEQEIETAKGILEKYMRGKVCDKTTLQKACRYLLGKGYDYEVVKAALTEFGDYEDD